MRSSRAILCAALLMALLTGCIRVELSITVEDGGFIWIESTAAAELDSVVEALGEGFEMPPEMMAVGDPGCDQVDQLRTETVPNITDFRFGAAVISPYRDGDLCGITSRYPYDPTRDLAGSTSAAIDSLFGAGPGEGRLKKVGDNWEFDTPLAIRALAGTNIRSFGFRGSNDPGFPDKFDDLFFYDQPMEIIIEVDLPGRAIDGRHNATSVDGGKFRWVIDHRNPPARLFAATEPSPGLSSGPFILGGAIAAIVLGIGATAWSLSANRRRGRAAVAGTTVPAGTANQSPTEPYFDDANGMWVLDDPVRGRMWHHAGTGDWVPF